MLILSQRILFPQRRLHLKSTIQRLNSSIPISINTELDCTNQGIQTGKLLNQLLQNSSLSNIQHENCILLTGHVGAGKSTFARGLIRELSPSAVDEDIPSPTYCLDFEYELDKHKNNLVSNRFPRGVHHLDLYRLPGTDPKDLDALEFIELTKRAVTLVEWPDRLATRNIALPGALWVDIQLSNDEEDSGAGNTEDMTEEMFEKWISTPRRLTFGCDEDSLWLKYIQGGDFLVQQT